jgi:cell division protein FtsL
MQQARQLYPVGRPVSPAYPSGKPSTRNEAGRRVKKVKLFCIVTIIFLLSLVTVAQYSSLVILNYRLSSVRTELTVVLDSSRTLELEVARLSSVGRIDQIAREELGMVDPEIEQLRVLTVGQAGDIRLGE